MLDPKTASCWIFTQQFNRLQLSDAQRWGGGGRAGGIGGVGGREKTKLVAIFRCTPKKGYKNVIQIREQEHRSILKQLLHREQILRPDAGIPKAGKTSQGETTPPSPQALASTRTTQRRGAYDAVWIAVQELVSQSPVLTHNWPKIASPTRP